MPNILMLSILMPRILMPKLFSNRIGQFILNGFSLFKSFLAAFIQLVTCKKIFDQVILLG